MPDVCRRLALTTLMFLPPLPLMAQAAANPARHAIDAAELDAAAGACHDFFGYVNGRWIQNHPVPADHSSWGVDHELKQRSLADLRTLVEGLLPNHDLTGDRRKIRDFYASAMAAAKLNDAGSRPLAAELARIDAVTDTAALARVLARLHVIGSGPWFSVYIDQDSKQSDRYALHLSQGGTSLPEREYYLGDDPESRALRQAYRGHVQRMFVLLGEPPAEAQAAAETVVAMETRLAEKQMTPTELRDPETQYHKMTRDQLQELAPHFNWEVYLDALGAADVRSIIVCQPEFFRRASELCHQSRPADWRIYLRWHLAAGAAPCLSDRFVDEGFRFEQVLGGAKRAKPRWQRALETIDGMMGDALGRLYVEQKFSAEAKQHIHRLADDLTEPHVLWLTECTSTVN